VGTDRWHSIVRLSLSADRSHSMSALGRHLRSLGFRPSADGDLYSLPRPDKACVWQSISIANVRCWSEEGVELYFDDPLAPSVSRVDLEYLLPWMPIVHARAFVDVGQALALRLGAQLTYNGAEIQPDQLLSQMHALADELTQRVDEPGSQFLAIAIEEKLDL
jgi:hypothetical protein